MKVGIQVSLIALLGAIGWTVEAQERVSMWVDEDGVTHFSNRQFAPPEAQEITVSPANGMVKPEGPAPSSSSGGPNWSKITLPPKQNPKGWRSRGESIYTGRKHRVRRPR
jgi:hypothetical protein